FSNHPLTPDRPPLSLHAALPICLLTRKIFPATRLTNPHCNRPSKGPWRMTEGSAIDVASKRLALALDALASAVERRHEADRGEQDRKSTRLNSSHLGISYAVFCL